MAARSLVKGGGGATELKARFKMNKWGSSGCIALPMSSTSHITIRS